MNLLITGGCGAIGRQLMRKLEKEGHDVYILDVKNHHNVPKFIVCDISDVACVRNIFNSLHFDGVIHLAAVSSVGKAEEDPKCAHRTNIIGTEIIATSISSTKKKPWLIFASSREVYGQKTLFPVTENDAVSPINIYGNTKCRGECILRRASLEFGLKAVSLRISNAYGGIPAHESPHF
jgi:nucleoside-diphosphate-sugar epimerase